MMLRYLDVSDFDDNLRGLVLDDGYNLLHFLDHRGHLLLLDFNDNLRSLVLGDGHELLHFRN